MQWFKISGPELLIQKTRWQLEKGQALVVHGKSDVFWARVDRVHPWHIDAAAELGVKWEAGDPPSFETAQCGKHVTYISRHTQVCNGCRTYNEPRPVEERSQAEAVANLPTGILGALKDKQRLALHLAEQYDTVFQGLSKLGRLNDQLATLSRDLEVQRRSAAAFVGQ